MQTFDPDRDDYLSLTPEQWRELRDGDWLTFPASEQPPLELGTEIVLEAEQSLAFTAEEVAAGIGREIIVESPVLWIEITEIRRTRKLLWRLLYRTVDMRPLWMRRGPPKPEGSRIRQRSWTAVDEHGMTGELPRALDPEAEVVDAGYRNVLEIGARLKRAERERRLDPEAERLRQAVNAEVRELIKRAVKMGADPALALGPVVREIEAQHRQIGEGKDAA